MSQFLTYIGFVCLALLLILLWANKKTGAKNHFVLDVLIAALLPIWLQHLRGEEWIDMEYRLALRRFRRAALLAPYWSQLLWLGFAAAGWLLGNGNWRLDEQFTPATLHSFPTLLGRPPIPLAHIPLPFFVHGEGWIPILGPLYSWMVCNLYMNRKAGIYFPVHNFKRDFLNAINTVKAYKEAGTPTAPKIDCDWQEAEINAIGTTLTTESIIAHLAEVENKIGCRLVTVRPSKKIGHIELEYTYRNFPAVMLWEDYVVYERPEFIPIGYNMVRQTGWDLNLFPHYLVAGNSGFGKSNKLKTAATSIFFTMPNSVIIFLELSKEGNVYKNFTQKASHLREYWAGQRTPESIELNYNVLLVTDERIAIRVINFLYEEKLRRDRLCGELDVRADDLNEMSQRPHYQTKQGLDELPPHVFLFIDEGAANKFTYGGGQARNGDGDDYAQARARLSRIIQTGRSSWMHVVLSVLAARFETLGPDRDQFYRTSVYAKPNELKIALGYEFIMPADKGWYAYTVENGISNTKAYKTDSMVGSEQAELAWDECNSATRELAQKAHEAAGQVFSVAQLKQIQMAFGHQPLIRPGQEITHESRTVESKQAAI